PRGRRLRASRARLGGATRGRHRTGRVRCRSRSRASPARSRRSPGLARRRGEHGDGALHGGLCLRRPPPGPRCHRRLPDAHPDPPARCAHRAPVARRAVHRVHDLAAPAEYGVRLAWRDDDRALLDKLNAASWTHSFSPEACVDSAITTGAEFSALYGAWSLLLGSRHDASLSEDQRIRFAKYQQMNLMLFTALFERYGLATFESFYDNDDDDRYHEYVTHFIKEETY